MEFPLPKWIVGVDSVKWIVGVPKSGKLKKLLDLKPPKPDQVFIGVDEFLSVRIASTPISFSIIAHCIKL